jgi:hypothetical protein
MATQVGNGRSVQCYVSTAEKTVRFLVKDISDYGVLQIEMI